MKFHYAYVPVLEWVHISRRVAWAYCEVLIIVFAMNASLMFRKFNQRLKRIQHQIMWHLYWKEMHDHFLELCKLVEHANSFASPLLAIFVFADFFFLCERLYRLCA